MQDPESYEWSGYTDIREKLVALARSTLGTPYKFGAKPEDAPEAFDCSSWTQYLYRQFGLELPRSGIAQAASIQKVTGTCKVGDLLFFQGGKGHYDDSLFPDEPNRIYIGHVAMYVGDGKIIHANGKTRSVAEITWQDLPEAAVRIGRVLAPLPRPTNF
ncbi:MAG: C40 family peptidase [bacterium]|nr:C40 family peptidase [bacterium]